MDEVRSKKDEVKTGFANRVRRPRSTIAGYDYTPGFFLAVFASSAPACGNTMQERGGCP